MPTRDLERYCASLSSVYVGVSIDSLPGGPRPSGQQLESDESNNYAIAGPYTLNVTSFIDCSAVSTGPSLDRELFHVFSFSIQLYS